MINPPTYNDFVPVCFRGGDQLIRWANAMSGFFGHPVYLVGSQLTKEKPRDIDIVVVIPDNDFKLRYIAYDHEYCKNRHTVTDHVEQWRMRYKTGIYEPSNWLWWDDMCHKSLQGCLYTNSLVDFKVISQFHDDKDYKDTPKLRIDERETKFGSTGV